MSKRLNLNFVRAGSFVPALSFFGVILLYFVVGDFGQIFPISVFVLVASIYGIAVRNRWIIVVACLFLYYFLGFESQTVFSGSHSISVIIIFLSTLGVYLWYSKVLSVRNALIGVVASIAMLEFFVVLLFWPINLVARSMLLVAFNFLILEIIDRAISHRIEQKSTMPAFFWSALGKEILVVVVIIIGVVISSKWFIF